MLFGRLESEEVLDLLEFNPFWQARFVKLAKELDVEVSGELIDGINGAHLLLTKY